MKNLILILLAFILTSCGNKTSENNDSIIGMEFQKFKQLKQLSNYTKVSDTSVFENNSEPKHGILHLRDRTNNLILFKSITIDSNQNRSFKILDSLTISSLNETEFVTIGYCQINKDWDENLIAIVNKTDSLSIQNINKVWRANTKSEKIENVKILSGINCLNEWFRPN